MQNILYMDNNKEEVGVEITHGGWGVDFKEDQSNTGNSRIWQDPFEEPQNEEAASAEDQEPLLEKDVEESEEVELDQELENEVPEIDNPIFFLAKQAAADGLIPSDVDIPEDVGLDFVYNHYKESIAPIAQKQALAEAENKLRAAGIKDENIALLQAIENDVPLDEVYEVTKYKKYSALSNDSEDDEKIKVVKAWYSKRGLSEKEVQRNLDAIEMNDEVDSEFTNAKDFFTNIVQDFEESQVNETAQRQRQEAELQQRNAQIINNLSTNFQIGEEKLSKNDAEFIVSSVYNKQPVEFGGQVYQLSPYEQFYISLNNDFEFSLKVFKDFMLKDKSEVKIKNKLKEEAENDWLEAYKKSQKKSTSTTSIKRKEDNKESTSTIKTTSTGGMYMEL